MLLAFSQTWLENYKDVARRIEISLDQDIVSLYTENKCDSLPEIFKICMNIKIFVLEFPKCVLKDYSFGNLDSIIGNLSEVN